MYTYSVADPGQVTLCGRVNSPPTYGAHLELVDLIHRLEIDPFVIDPLFQLTGVRSETSSGRVLGFKPGTDSFSEPIKRWSTYINNLRGLFSGFNFSTLYPNLKSENEVFHLNLKGNSSFSGLTTDWLRPSTDPTYVSSVKVVSPFDSIPYLVYSDPSSGPEYSGSWTRDLAGILSASYNVGPIVSGQYLTYSEILDVSPEIVDGVVRAISFTTHQWAIRNDGWISVGYYGVYYRPALVYLPFVGDIHEFVGFDSLVSCTLENRNSLYASAWLPPGSSLDLSYDPRGPSDLSYWSSWGGLLPQAHEPLSLFLARDVLSVPDVSLVVGLHVDNSFTYRSPTSYARFRDASFQIYPSTFTGMAFSSEDAVSKMWQGVSLNLLEYLAELNDIGALISVGALFSKVRSIGTRTGLPLLFYILDLLADQRLIYSFGIAPLLRDAETVSRKSKALLDLFLFDEVFAEKEYRGSVEVVIPEDIWGFYNPSYVRNRSKIRVSIAPDSFLSGLIGLDAIGVLPSLSKLWELVPFSFVVDWFTGLGTRQQQVERFAMMIGMNCQLSVHSTTVLTPWSSMDLPIGMSFDNETIEKELGYQLYARAVMTTLPVPGPTKLPYWTSGSLPSWETPTALLWKFLTR